MNPLPYIPLFSENKSQQKEVNDKQIIKLFLAWTVSFFILEPLTSLLLLDNKKYLTPLTLLTDFAYTSIVFLKSIHVYKFFVKGEYFPKQLSDIPLFLSVYITIQLCIDIFFLVSTRQSGINYPLKEVFRRYTPVTSISHSATLTTYGIIWVLITYIVHARMHAIDAIAVVIGSLFVMLLLSYPTDSLKK
jgi:hypothetical protein